MSPEQTDSSRPPCPRCQAPMVATTVRTAIWQNDRLAVVEDIPAYVCNACVEQFYDEDVSEALRRLGEEGFPAAAAKKTILVAVFSLAGRIRKRGVIAEDSYVD